MTQSTLVEARSGFLVGKVALVTGGGRGLGAAISRKLAECGANVIVADVRIDLGAETASRLRDDSLLADAVCLDVSDAGAIDAGVQKLIERFEHIDVLINNAGTDVTAPVEELSVDDWDRILAVNLRGPFVVTKAVLPSMKARRDGHIVNIVSTAAKRAWANATPYHASKWGLLGLSHALHVEARPFGVKVTAVVAGGMRTPFLLDRFPDLDPNLLQSPENVAETVRFVLSQPAETVIPEVMVLPMRETSWP